MTDNPVNLKTVQNSIYDLLEPLESEQRKRVINAALTLLGDEAIGKGGSKSGVSDADEETADDGSGLHPKVQKWMKTFSVTREQLNSVFHIDGQVELIASDVRGKGGKEKTINAYVLTGLGRFLETGDAAFDDKSGRASCVTVGCFSGGNHANYLREKGNVLSGSKNAGWKITGPGMKAAADLVKAMAGE